MPAEDLSIATPAVHPDGPPAVTSVSHSWRSALAHHLLVALWVAALVGILHHLDKLAWLDATMLKLAGGASSHYAEAPHSGSADDQKLPIVLLIGEGLYEEAFRSRSPLDRRLLATIVQRLRESGGSSPSTVVVDLEVADSGHDEGQVELDRELEKLLQGKTRLVLPLPDPVSTPQALALRVAWVRKVCGWQVNGGRVMFATSSLTVHSGQVLQYTEQDYSLGVAATGGLAAQDICQLPASAQAAMMSTRSAGQTAALQTSRPQHSDFRPYNARFFAALPGQVRVLASANAWPAADSGGPLDLSGRTVFVGGAYSDRDRFRTPLDPDGLPVEGAVLHAATYYSIQSPVTKEQGLIALLLDVAIGVAAGYVFHALWHWRAMLGRLPGWRGYLATKAAFVAIAGVAILFTIGLVWAAARWGYSNNYWVSPGPVIIGVLIKLLLSSRDVNHAVSPPAGAVRMERALLLVLILMNIAYIFFH